MKISDVHPPAARVNKPPAATIRHHGEGRYCLTLVNGTDTVFYYSHNIIKLREFVEKYFRYPVQWEPMTGDPTTITARIRR